MRSPARCKRPWVFDVWEVPAADAARDVFYLRGCLPDRRSRVYPQGFDAQYHGTFAVGRARSVRLLPGGAILVSVSHLSQGAVARKAHPSNPRGADAARDHGRSGIESPGFA